MNTIRAAAAATLSLFSAIQFCPGEIVISETPVAPKPKEPSIVVPKPKDEGSGAAKEKEGDALTFFNRDALHGKLLSIDPKIGVRWQHPDAAQAIEFKTGNIDEVRLESPASPAKAQDREFVVQLNNEDELPGTIVSLNEERIQIATSFAGQLTIPRKVIKGITPLLPSASAIYAGPTGMEGWKSRRGSSSWKYKDGALYGRESASIWRAVKMPDSAGIDFDLAWRGDLQLMISFLGDSSPEEGGNGYSLQLNRNWVNLQKMQRNQGSNEIGQAQLRNLLRGDQARIGLRIDKATKKISMLIDGKVVDTWTDRSDFIEGGKVLGFYPQSEGDIKISNIKVTPWNGKLEPPSKPKEKAAEDIVELENGDKVSGKLKAIADGKATFDSSYATLTIPVARIERVEFSAAGVEKPAKTADEVRVALSERGKVSMVIEKWDQGGVVGSSRSFGRANFIPGAFASIQFNLDRPRKSTDEFADFENSPAPAGRAGPRIIRNFGIGGGVINLNGAVLNID